jgi:hypothetical protein
VCFSCWHLCTACALPHWFGVPLPALQTVQVELDAQVVYGVQHVASDACAAPSNLSTGNAPDIGLQCSPAAPTLSVTAGALAAGQQLASMGALAHHSTCLRVSAPGLQLMPGGMGTPWLQVRAS